MDIRPRRSLLYMPASNARAMEKARELPADGVILDLEDAVAPDAKAKARELIVAALKQGGFVSGEEPWREVAKHLVGVRAEARIGIWAMMETPLAMLNARDIAAMARDAGSRLAGFVMGTNDLAKDTRARLLPGRAPMLPWLMTCIAAARAYGIDIVDGVYNELGNAEGFAAECRQARDLGFDGKTLIHPQQIAPCNEAFSPGADEVSWARTIIGAFDLTDEASKGVIQVDGRMVERLHADMAQRTVAIADAIAAAALA